VKDSLLYVQPIYVLSSNGQQPAFRDVIVYYNGSAAISKTLTGALAQFPAFNGIGPPAAGGGTTAPQPPANPGGSTVDALLDQANTAYAAAQNALKNQDLATYQAQIQKLGGILNDLAKARAKEQGTSSSSSTSSSSTTSTTRPRTSGTQALGPPR
jgi:thiazolylpeptide-type bacteriocin precursor